jgi:hypothetical protein
VDVGGCNEHAVGEFRETENTSSSTASGILAISETKFCVSHEENVVRGLNGYTVYYPINI